MPALSKKKPRRTQAAVPESDILIVGAGPAGLSLANLLADSGWRITLIEQQNRAALAQPADDGREIALTHLSRRIMQQAGMWQQLPTAAIAPIRHAKVANNHLGYLLHFDHQESGEPQLGFMVANHAIRRAAWAAAQRHPNITVLTESSVTAASTEADMAWVKLADGRLLHGQLLIAADSRFSKTRAMLGFPVRERAFKRSCIVTRLAHRKSHDETALECFLRDHTLAVLPLNGQQSSIVVTVDSKQAEDWLQASDKDFARRVETALDGRLGDMRCLGARHHYPLTGIYARRFAGTRCALLGDAAVGMHPVTAHGFNFGLRGAATLAQALADDRALGLPLGDTHALRVYDQRHRRATLPLYEGTNILVGLYTDNRPPAQLARAALLRLGQHIAPARRAIIGQLTEAAA